MAQTIERQHISYLTDGAPKVLAATATAGDILHTAIATAGKWDEIFLELFNKNTSTARTVTLEIDAGAAVTILVIDIPAKATIQPFRQRLVLKNGVKLRCFCASGATDVFASGYVNRITQS